MDQKRNNKEDENPSNNANIEQDACSCEGSQLVLQARDGKEHCRHCGKEIQRLNSHPTSSTTRTVREHNLPAGFHRTLYNGLLSLPLTCNAEEFCEGSDVWTRAIATGQLVSPRDAPRFKNIPVEGDSHSSMQIPPPLGTQFKIYILEQEQADGNGLIYYLHFVTEQRYNRENVSTWIKRMEQKLGVKLRPLPMGEEQLSQEESSHFPEATIEGQIKVKFKLVKQVESKFRIYGQTEFQIPLHRLLALSENRLFPGAAAKVFVIPLEPTTCEDHLRISLQYGETVRNMIATIWSSSCHDM